MDYVYHYTDGEGANSILNSGIIRASTSNTEAVCGRGVFFTEFTPDKDKFILLLNNYDDGKQLVETNWNKTNFCFAIQKRHLKGLKKCSKRRNVWLYPNDVVLENFDFLFGPTDGKHELESYMYVQY